MTGGRVAPFFMPFQEVTFAVGHVGLDRAIEVGSWRECLQRCDDNSEPISHSVLPPQPLSFGRSDLPDALVAKHKEFALDLNRHGLSAEEPVVERSRRQPLTSEACWPIKKTVLDGRPAHRTERQSPARRRRESRQDW
jgi:hypothetical protein